MKRKSSPSWTSFRLSPFGASETKRDFLSKKSDRGTHKQEKSTTSSFLLLLKPQEIGLFGPPNNLKKQEVFICLNKKNDAEVEKYFQLTGKKHGNQLIGEVVMTYARFIDFSPDTGLATRFVSYKSDDGRVLMDPELHFGEPFIESCGYTAYTLFNAYQTELSVERAAKIYDVEPREIRLAMDYYDYLNPVAA